MKIAKIEFENHPIFKSSCFDFTKPNGEIYNNILIAGENGAGKTTFLETLPYLEVLFKSGRNRGLSPQLLNNFGNSKIAIEYEYNQEYISLVSTPKEGVFREVTGFDHKVNFPLKLIYSSVDINYSSNSRPQAVTNKQLDENTQSREVVIGTPNNLSDEIVELLISINSQDNNDTANWVHNHPGEVFPVDTVMRMDRFKNAFNYMFDNLEFHGVENNIEPKFKKTGQEDLIDIYKLSSGEKQVVFRGSFLLKDKNSLEGVTVLIDEPELSMHPKWQEKIFNYYTELFKNEEKEQTSQIFMVTHSDHVLKSGLQDEDTLVNKLSSNSDPEFFHSAMNLSPSNFVLDTLTSAEVFYQIFGIYSVEFHQLLFEKMLEQHKVKFGCYPGYMDVRDKYTHLKQGSNDMEIPNEWIQPDEGCRQTYFLPLYIRNYIDHSADKNSDGSFSRDGKCIESENLSRSIEFMIQKISELSRKEEIK
ncbi:AAA family ATPase [Lactococcus garvieae]